MRVSRLQRSIQALALALALAPTWAGATIYNFTGKATKIGPVPAAPENQQNSVISIGGLFTTLSAPGDLRAYQIRMGKVLYSNGLGSELLQDPKVPVVFCPDVRRSRPGNAVYVLPPGGSARPNGRATVSLQGDGSVKFRIHMNRALIGKCEGNCIDGSTPPLASITTTLQLVPRDSACGAPVLGGTALAPESITVDWKELTEVDGIRLRFTGGDGSGPTASSLPKPRVTVNDTNLGNGLYQVVLSGAASSSAEPVFGYQFSVVERDSGNVVVPPTAVYVPADDLTVTIPGPGDFVAVMSLVDITGQVSNPARRGFRLH